MVSLRDSNFCGVAPSLRSARRSDWRDAVFGEESVAPVRLFFRAGVVVE